MPTDPRRPRPSSPEPWQRLPTTATWSDLVTAPPVLAQLRQIAAEASVRFRGFTPNGLTGGIAALFTGQRGTGKTMAAQVLANTLQVEIYRIDLSQVVSKYIGETEKNLRRVFDAAEHAHAVLFFDEADALFGQRSEVKDSQDRYANLEVACLLERLEQFKGVAILATYSRSALDPAFVRRVRYVVEFPLPDTEQRLAIWRRVFPPGLDCLDLDYGRLAQVELSGGDIRNIAQRAYIQATAAASPVMMTHVLEATEAERYILGRLRSAAGE